MKKQFQENPISISGDQNPPSFVGNRHWQCRWRRRRRRGRALMSHGGRSIDSRGSDMVMCFFLKRQWLCTSSSAVDFVLVRISGYGCAAKWLAVDVQGACVDGGAWTHSDASASASVSFHFVVLFFLEYFVLLRFEFLFRLYFCYFDFLERLYSFFMWSFFLFFFCVGSFNLCSFWFLCSFCDWIYFLFFLCFDLFFLL